MYSDEQWLERLRGTREIRDPTIQSLRELMLRALSKGLGGYLNGSAYVEDITQEALLKVLASLDQYEHRSRFTTWAVTIATRTGISTLRRKYHQNQSLEAFADDDGVRIDVMIEEPIDSPILKTELLEMLQDLINTELTSKQRTVIRALLDGFSTDGIAERMNASRNSVYKMLHDARIKLREGLARNGFLETDILDTIG